MAPAPAANPALRAGDRQGAAAEQFLLLPGEAVQGVALRHAGPC